MCSTQRHPKWKKARTMRPDPMSIIAVIGMLVVLSGSAIVTGCSAPSATAPKAAVTTTAPAAVASSTASSTVPASSTVAVPTEKPIAPEQNPPGDIPDNQAFVAFSPAPFVSLKYPEGWSRQQAATSVSFTDKLNTIDLAWSSAGSAPTVDSVKAADVPKLAATTPAFELVSVKAVTLPAGPAVLTKYRANSAANPVTGKKYRLDVERYTVFRNGRRVDLTLLSPTGSDNVDPWRIVSRSVAWKQ
jgi:hypothetical protein